MRRGGKGGAVAFPSSSRRGGAKRRGGLAAPLLSFPLLILRRGGAKRRGGLAALLLSFPRLILRRGGAKRRGGLAALLLAALIATAASAQTASTGSAQTYPSRRVPPGLECRSSRRLAEAIAWAREGSIGKIVPARGIC